MATLDEMLLAAEDEKDPEPDEGQFLKALFRSLVVAIKASNAVPGQEDQQASGSDYSYHAIFPEFTSKASEAQGSVLELINAISRHVDPENVSASLSLDEATDPSAYEGLSDMVEDLLEEVDAFLQQDSGPIAQAAQVADRLRQVAGVARRTAKSYKSMLAQLQDLPKPQDAFQEEIDNSRQTPFMPRPPGKPLWKAPIDSSLEAPHPYEEEIRNFECMTWQLTAPEAAHKEDTASSPPVIMVQTEEELLRMIEQVREELDSEGERAIAVDLEAHSIRSFQGLVCLMQLSTRTQDYLVDTLALRKHMGIMSDLLADHTIVKVFHGAESDIKWLQRDFSLYVVNLFDTFLAAKRLQLPGLSLAYLLDKYCGIKADKSYQLADWRVRPLPDDMIRYAREDTHSLLYIFDRMRQELNNTEGRIGLAGVVDSGRELCCLRYKKDAFDPSGYQLMLEKALRIENKRLGPAEIQVLKALYDWRDRYARLADESTLFVCPDRTLMRIAQMMPQTFNSLQECGNPLPPLVAKNAEAVLALVSSGLECYASEQLRLETADNSSMTGMGEVSENMLDPMQLQLEPVSEGMMPGPFSMDDDGSGLNSGPSSVAGGGLSRMRASASPFTLSFGNPPFASAALPIDIPTSAPFPARPSASSINNMKVVRLASSPDQLSTSPVLPTEDLYQTAGWTAPLPSSSCTQQRLNDDGGNLWDEGRQELLGAAGLGMRGGQGLSALPALDNTGLETHRPLGHSMQLSEDPEDDSDDERLSAALRIREEFATGHMGWGFTGPVEFQEDGVRGDRGVERDELEDGEDEEAREGAVGAEDEEAMPRSMADIYRISNRNRRRNKEKKKSNEPINDSLEDMEDGGNTAPQQSDELLQDTSSGDPEVDAYFVGAKRKKADADDAVKYMASIGWISGKDLVLPPNPSMVMQAAQGAAMNAGMGNKGAPFDRATHPEGGNGQAMLSAYGRQSSDGDDSFDGGSVQQWQGGGRPSPNSFRRQFTGNSPPMHGHQGRHMPPRTSSPLAGYSHHGPSLDPPGMTGYQSSQGTVHSSASNSPRRPMMAQQSQPPLPRRFVDYSNLPPSVVSAMSSNLSAYDDPSAPRGPPFHHMPNVPPQFQSQAPPLQHKYNPYVAAQQMSAMGMADMGGQAVMNPSKLNPHQGQQSVSSPWRNRLDARGPPMGGLPPNRWNK